MIQAASEIVPYDPAIWEIYKDADQVQQGIRAMAGFLVEHYAGENPMYLALLKGANFFAQHLMTEIALQSGTHPDLHHLQASSYGDSQVSGELKFDGDYFVTSHPKLDLTDRPLAFVEDMLDTGKTLHSIDKFFAKAYSPLKIESFVLVEKMIPREVYRTATRSCFKTQDIWFAGAGMDDGEERYRHLPYIMANGALPLPEPCYNS